MCLLSPTDQCVDKAKVEESEQKATDFSKKVRRSLILVLGHWYAAMPLTPNFFPSDFSDEILIAVC